MRSGPYIKRGARPIKFRLKTQTAAENLTTIDTCLLIRV